MGNSADRNTGQPLFEMSPDPCGSVPATTSRYAVSSRRVSLVLRPKNLRAEISVRRLAKTFCLLILACTAQKIDRRSHHLLWPDRFFAQMDCECSAGIDEAR